MPLFHSLPTPEQTFTRRARTPRERLMNQVAQQLLFPDMNNSWVSMGNDPLVEKGVRGFNVRLQGRYEQSELGEVITALHQAGWKVIRIKYKTVNEKTRTTIVLSEWFNTGNRKDVGVRTTSVAVVCRGREQDQHCSCPGQAAGIN